MELKAKVKAEATPSGWIQPYVCLKVGNFEFKRLYQSKESAQRCVDRINKSHTPSPPACKAFPSLPGCKSESGEKVIAAAIEMDKANNSGDTVSMAMSQLRLSDAVTEREALLNALFVAKGGLEDE